MSLKTYRERAGLTQTALARMARVKQPTIHRLEKVGIKMRATAERYAKILKCRWQDLMD